MMEEPGYKKTVAYLGPDQTTFGYIAAERFFGNGYELRPYATHRDICEAVGDQAVDYGIIAIENMIDGAIAESVKAMEDTAATLGVSVCGEVIVPIELYYLRSSRTDIPPKVLKSHQSPLRQCSRFVAELQRQGVRVEASASTGEAAREASEDSDIAAIGNSKAQEMFKLLRVQDESVADLSNNQTRFWVISQTKSRKTGNDKTCILVNLDHDGIGVLYQTLGFFSKHGISLLWLYANPIPGRLWEYTFLLDLAGHVTDNQMKNALRELRESGLCLNNPLVLGSYPAAYEKERD